MFYRQKILLALLDACGGSLSNTDFEKLLFLYCKRTKSTHYDFFPYKFGGFSFVSYYDKRKLTEKGCLIDNNKFTLATSSRSYLNQIKLSERKTIRVFAAQTNKLRGNQLIRTAYNEFPSYAQNSEIISAILNNEEYQKARSHWQVYTDPALITLGYEGLSIDTYLNKLIKNGVTALVDVRKNPISRKYGFSKKSLSNSVEKTGISYYHLPELGIPSHLRKNLDGIQSYNALFEFYDSQILSHQKDALDTLKKIIREYNRIALTCFEADYHMCHRNKLVQVLQNELISPYPIHHL